MFAAFRTAYLFLLCHVECVHDRVVWNFISGAPHGENVLFNFSQKTSFRRILPWQIKSNRSEKIAQSLFATNPFAQAKAFL
uniref:Putative secreted protein n=1 Tax=Anopheles triannulatus TaxID=58253 RepID=A0A2M4B1A9_9DIPT